MPLLALLAAAALGAAPPPLRLDREGVPLPTHAVARFGSARFAGAGIVAITADGKRIASLATPNHVRVYDRLGAVLAEVDVTQHGVPELQEHPPWFDFTSRGDLVFVAPSGRCIVRDGATGVRSFSLSGPAQSAAVRPDGGVIVSGGDDGFSLFDARDGRRLVRLGGPGMKRDYRDLTDADRHCHLAFSPDGLRVARTDDNGFLRLHDSRTGRILASHDFVGARYQDGGRDFLGRRRPFGPEETVSITFPSGVAFVADKLLLLGGSTPAVLDPHTCEVLRPFTGSSGFAGYDLVTGRFVMSDHDTLGLYDQRTARLRTAHSALLPEPAEGRLELGPSILSRVGGGVAIVSYNLNGYLFDLRRGEYVHDAPEDRRPLIRVRPTRGGVMTLDEGGRFQARDPYTGRAIAAARPAGWAGISDLDVFGYEQSRRTSPDGRLVIASDGDGRDVVREAAGGKVTFRPTVASSRYMIFRPDGRAVVGYGGDVVRIVPLPDAKGEKPVTLRVAEARAVAFSPDGRVIAVTASHDIAVYSADGRRRAVLRGHAQRVNDLAFSEDGRTLFSAGEDGTCVVWRVPREGEDTTGTEPREWHYFRMRPRA